MYYLTSTDSKKQACFDSLCNSWMAGDRLQSRTNMYRLYVYIYIYIRIKYIIIYACDWLWSLVACEQSPPQRHLESRVVFLAVNCHTWAKKTKTLESGQQHNNLQPVTFWEPKGSTASRVKVMGNSQEIQVLYTLLYTNIILQVCITICYTKVWLSACRRYISTVSSKCRLYNTNWIQNWMQFNWQIWFQPLQVDLNVWIYAGARF